jgi:predicted  nucleic acid-binding Zn-ribbon protein
MANNADTIDLMNENTRLKAEVERLKDMVEVSSEIVRIAQAKIEWLRAEVSDSDKAYEYKLQELRAAEARIEAALEICERADDDHLVDRAAVVEALTGGREK